MGRIRTVKPGFYKHEELFEAEKLSGLPLRVAFSGLWTVCDREGRFVWKPRMLKTDILPYDEVDFSDVLDALEQAGFIEKYTVDGRTYGQVPSWSEHQVINPRESKSVIPPPDASPRVEEVANPAHGEGKGREGKGKEDATGAEHPITPSMVAQGILTECLLAGKDLLNVLTDVVKAESKLPGYVPGDLRDAMVASYREYEAAPLTEYAPRAAKFFGEGYWRNKAKWPLKEGCVAPSTKSLTLLEKVRLQKAAS
jgi:hypothetical protein